MIFPSLTHKPHARLLRRYKKVEKSKMSPKNKKRGGNGKSKLTEPAAKSAKKELDNSTEDVTIESSTDDSRTAAKSSGEDKGNKEAHSFWLMKSEPESRIENGVDVKFGVEDLKAQQNQTACWDGVRNYQARNFMRDMKLGQLAFFYHSNCKEPGIAALIKIVKESYVDHTQFDKKDPHYDPRSSKQNPKWFMVDVQFVRMMKRYISLAELKRFHQEHKTKNGPLKNMALFTRARLSVQPVTKVSIRTERLKGFGESSLVED
ncbi:thymocyte nuclear protein 1 isoform X4 [Rhincodon typus]|uniref:thymocyte nuclear protein 1 isoform X4 n=1 Tax=Rhincodon typus TaxID=259920 RepID=UPI00202E1279|nr:thymocyte nuclear protein 1 isoform X4 [Rhincodon typus]